MKDFTNLLPSVNASNFEDIALKVFHFQYKSNLLYQSYARALGKVPGKVNSIREIPFLPIRFFKTHPVISGIWNVSAEFTSSSTTGVGVSKHEVWSLDFYLESALSIFEQFYGSIKNYHFLALLPSYLERKGSSLIAMIDHFIKNDETGHSGYFLNNHEDLLHKINSLRNSKKKILLWGVSFALVDLAEKYEVDLGNGLIMETGGMKGRRKEWVKEEFHRFLCKRFNVNEIHSEYGMTELFSQAYSKGKGYFQNPPWMKVITRDINDPFEVVLDGKTGAINIIDLANVHSCAFLETEDLGRIIDRAGFEILGRMDNSDIRGCNLLIS
ncbi:MAG: acyl transferase [Bacteroidetes bacterium]|nr:acyl transferase [Bacteroidota bacterium]MBI3482994.1 acyl transferase [Bacteroidota bacterium]